MKYDFDSVINHYNTNSIKWDFAKEVLGEKDILPMWVADMDFKSPEPVIDAMKKVAKHGVFGYSNMRESYYEEVIKWMKRQHNWDVQKEWIVFSPGVIPAINMLIKAFTQQGDQVIVQSPTYHAFFFAIRNNGRQILDNPLRLEDEQYVMELADLEQKINHLTKMILLCSPHNPVGRVWRREELITLGELCIKNGILVVSDEIHMDMVYKGYQHTPFASISEEYANKSIVCTGATKTFNLPGLQMSAIIVSNPELRKQFRDVLRGCGIYFPNIFGIAATEAAYRYGKSWLMQLLEYLQENVAFLTKYVKEKIPRIKVIPPQGTYLVWLDCRNIGVSPTEVHKFMLKEAKVGLEEGTTFGCKEAGYERMNIACPRVTLKEALRRIETALSLLPKSQGASPAE